MPTVVRSLITLFCFVTVFTLLVPGGVFAKPNILYIFTDDQSYRSVGAYSGSHSWVNTPNIDKLAKNGTKFKFAYPGAKCKQSRGVALTGRYQFKVTESSPYWVSHFKKNGYNTGIIGKWHWGQVKHNENWTKSAVWEHHLNNSDYYVNQPVRINGGSNVTLKYSTDGYTDYAVKYIKNWANSDKPWYLWLCYAGVHGPYTPAARHKGDYSGKKVDIPSDIFSGRNNKPEYIKDLTTWKKGSGGTPTFKKKSLHAWEQQYNEAVKSIDQGVGRIMETLKATGQLNNTIVIFTSDQGYAWGQHGWKGKMHPHDAAIRAPLIFHQPGTIEQGKTYSAAVNGFDIVKTIHSFAGITPKIDIDGRNLKKMLKGNATQPDNEVMLQAFMGDVKGSAVGTAVKNKNWGKLIVDEGSKTPSWMLIVSQGFKYIRYLANNEIEELYNLNKDPNELKNLAADPGFKSKLENMRSKFNAALVKNNVSFRDHIPRPKRYYKPEALITLNQNNVQKLGLDMYFSHNGELNIINSTNEQIEVEIYNLQGRSYVTKQGFENLSISKAELPVSHYYISISRGGKQILYSQNTGIKQKI